MHKEPLASQLPDPAVLKAVVPLHQQQHKALIMSLAAGLPTPPESQVDTEELAICLRCFEGKVGREKNGKKSIKKAVRSQKLSILLLLIFRFYSLAIFEVSIIIFEYLRLAVAELQEKTYQKIPTTRAEWKLLWDRQLAMICLSVACFEGRYNNWNKETPQ